MAEPKNEKIQAPVIDRSTLGYIQQSQTYGDMNSETPIEAHTGPKADPTKGYYVDPAALEKM